MRRFAVLLLACACTGSSRQAAQSVGPADSGAPDGSVGLDGGPDGADAGPQDAGIPNDAGVADAGASDAGIADAGASDAGIPDAGAPDAGGADGGLAYTPIVGADGGEMSLVVAPEPGSSCAAWMPQPVEPLVTEIDTSPDRYFWGGATTNGRGDVLLTLGTDSAWHYVAPSADGGVRFISFSGAAVPEADGFLLESITQGPCLICQATFLAYPDGGSIAMGDGYDGSRNCDFAGRAEHDGAYVSCVGPLNQNAPPTFARYDDKLQPLWSVPGDGNFILAADANDKLLETDWNDRWRWVDESLAPLSDWFPAATRQFGLAPLIGGGFLDRDLRFIPSGSADVSAAPDWLAARSGVSIVLGGRAYGLVADDCTVEIRDPAGTLCGTVTIVNCRGVPWPGYDGTITIQKDVTIGPASHGTFVSWPGLLR